MKITKTRLKEIIREELLIVRENQTEPGIDSPIWRDEPLGAKTAQPDLPSWEGDPFGEYDLEAENAKGFEAELARRVRSEPDNASFWQKILAAVEKANLFPRAEGLGEPRDNPLREDADDDRDFEIEEATRDGHADGSAGKERSPPMSFASRYYNRAYDRAVKEGSKK